MDTATAKKNIAKSGKISITGILLVSALLLFAGNSLFGVPDSFTSIVKTEKMKVVHIATTTNIKRPAEWDPFFERFFPNVPKERKSNALGSGFFVSKDGYILTNSHVVKGADKIQVYTIDERKHDAKLIGTDPRTDLALIKIDGSDFPVATLGKSSELEIGDWAIAIGNPLGLDFSVTAGIISATERSIGNIAYGRFIQTDAAINFGNSGGPLFNIKGEVIGINTMIAASAQGLSFAVPVDVAKNIIQQLKKTGTVKRGRLGIGIQNLTHEMKSGFSIPLSVKGVLINHVGKDTPAEKSGLKEGDVILTFDGHQTEKVGMLQQAVAESKPNKSANVNLYRNGKKITLKVTVGLSENKDADEKQFGTDKNRLGVSLKYISVAEAKNSGYPYSGAIITKIDPAAEISEMGIQVGDLIRQVNKRKFKSLEEFYRLIKESKGKSALLLIYKPNRGNIYITIKK